jgi:hypothetical protein
LPTDPIVLRFDWEGRDYLRTYNAVTRFDSRSWREIPFDFGEESVVFHGGGGGGEKPYKASSAIILPSGGGGGLHNGGMGVSPQGQLVVSCRNPKAPETREDAAARFGGEEVYTPSLWPGRHRGYELHVFDAHGRVRQMDVAPGIGWDNDLHLGRNGEVWMLAASTPYLDGQPYFNRRGCTLIKFVPGQLRVLTPNGVIPLPERQRPNRPFDITRPDAWVEGAEWLFGPVGADGHYGSGGSCHCQMQGRFALDYYGRAFAPEVDRFRVVVLDANGNVVVRIGQYGNVDDGKPLVAPEPAPADAHGRHPPAPRAIGGDEVAIMHCLNVAVHSDRRLFLSDVGNQCVRSVKLGYHTEETVALKKVPDRQARAGTPDREKHVNEKTTDNNTN